MFGYDFTGLTANVLLIEYGCYDAVGSSDSALEDVSYT